MSIIKKNKKGMSLAELLAAIAVIGVASSTITTMIITSYKGQLRAAEYVLSDEIARTYDAVLARDIRKASLNITKTENGSTKSWWPESREKKYVIVAGFDEDEEIGYNDGEILKTITGGDGKSEIYRYLYGEDTEHFQLNEKIFDKKNVKIEIYMISPNFGYYKTKVTVKYSTDREVTYSGTHFSENS